MKNSIRVIGYNPCSLIDGYGLREVIYIAGCTHYCKNCQNQSYWEDNGEEWLIKDVVNKLISNPNTDITISGGDGLTIQYENTLELLRQIKSKSNKNIWLYTGYTWEQLINSYKKEILQYIDVLVDGKYKDNLRDISLAFRGSSNQRIIDVQKSLKENKIIEERFE